MTKVGNETHDELKAVKGTLSDSFKKVYDRVEKTESQLRTEIQNAFEFHDKQRVRDADQIRSELKAEKSKAFKIWMTVVGTLSAGIIAWMTVTYSQNNAKLEQDRLNQLAIAAQNEKLSESFTTGIKEVASELKDIREVTVKQSNDITSIKEKVNFQAEMRVELQSLRQEVKDYNSKTQELELKLKGLENRP